MVKRGTKPGVHCVTRLTVLWRKLGAGCQVVRYARAEGLGTLIFFRVAGIALRRQPRKLADRSLLVAVIALQRGVRPD